MKKFAKKGQGMVEYLGAVLVAAAIVVGLIALAPGVLSTLFNDVFDSVTSQLT
jgi:Flp pilus assembly pilin Flp